MPNYDFLNEKTGQIKTLFFHMNDEKKYIDESGHEWVRQFGIPQAAISTISNIDPNNKNQFVEVTGKKRGTLGDMQDLSKELSLKREQKEGVDGVKQKFYENYSKERKGRKHLNQKKEELKKSLNDNPKSPFTIDI